jgi:hypothetical protein
MSSTSLDAVVRQGLHQPVTGERKNHLARPRRWAFVAHRSSTSRSRALTRCDEELPRQGLPPDLSAALTASLSRPTFLPAPSGLRAPCGLLAAYLGLSVLRLRLRLRLGLSGALRALESDDQRAVRDLSLDPLLALGLLLPLTPGLAGCRYRRCSWSWPRLLGPSAVFRQGALGPLSLCMEAVAESRLGNAAARPLSWAPEGLGVTTSAGAHFA